MNRVIYITKVMYKSGVSHNNVTESEAIHDNFISMLFVSCGDMIECVYTWIIEI